MIRLRRADRRKAISGEKMVVEIGKEGGDRRAQPALKGTKGSKRPGELARKKGGGGLLLLPY